MGDARDTRADVKADAKTAKAKFEASAEQIRRPTGTIAMGGADARPEPRSVADKEAAKGGPQAPGEGMGRLMKAKKKAQERTLGRPNPQSIVALTDFAARSDRVIRSSA